MDDPFLEQRTIPPPIHPEDPGSPPPASILLDPRGYLSARTNATTAGAFTRSGHRVFVTFWPAHPPRVSCFSVHCPDLRPSALGDMPRILTTERDLVLLRVAVCCRSLSSDPECNDYFVYHAGAGPAKPPSLTPIPSPPAFLFSDADAGLLPCRDGDAFFVAALRWAAFHDGQYDLHLYSSRTATWRTKLTSLRSPKTRVRPNTSKVITIGGELGSVGFVDLWQGILIADVLLDNDSLRYIPLPPPLVPRPFAGPPLIVRDIIVLEGCIKYFEMHKQFNGGWEAATWIRKDSWKEWKDGCKIKVCEPSANDPASTEVTPSLQEGESMEQPTLKGFYSGYPALSLHDDDVVYIMDRHDLRDVKALVIAVDLRKKTLKGVAHFGPGRPLGFASKYLQSGISKFLDFTS
ncbi:hypothetical protein ACP70R_044520 [Stipagrostis hirtigluma subsp. patula]